MDWAKAVERNREALKGIVATIVMMLEQAGGAMMTRMSRPLHRAVLGVLRPAESALRRLIVIVARDVVVKPAPVRAMPQLPMGPGGRRQRLAFQLFDPPRRLALRRRAAAQGGIPRIHFFGPDPRIAAFWPSPGPAVPAPPAADGRIDARRLLLRIEALQAALDDLPAHARRLVRLQARRARAAGLAVRSPLRLGRPPGYRRTPIYEVDRVLAECHELACGLELDTS
jgi:hypothetical protein